ncbi:MAG: thioredoxin [Lachnospiraceae bacterium]|nr:thioredoxin [Lachnospiraceae bacterium]
MAEVMLTKDNFAAEVLNSDIPVLVDFWAPWCGPCKMAGPLISEIAEEYDGKIKVGKVNVDEEEELASEYNVMSIPMVAGFIGGELKNKIVGLRSKAEYVNLVL